MSVRREASGSDGPEAEAALREHAESLRGGRSRVLNADEAAAVEKAIELCLALSEVEPKKLRFSHQRALSVALSAAAIAQQVLESAPSEGGSRS